MSYQVLYRTYRPTKFSEVVGQDYVIKTLVNALKNKHIAHAYLFAGPRGTGKTSVAKLFAKAINCEHFSEESCDECKSCLAYKQGNHPDIIEMDAASNNGVDEIRDIIEQIPYAPLVGKYKVYIIDEVHMMSASAFNALLKTLEEPPTHVVFILATTDPQKILPTVLSRCQRYNFAKITNFEIKKRIEEVLKLEGLNFESEATNEIAKMAEGGMRDGLSLVEQCLAYNPSGLYLEDVQHIFGLASTSKELELLIKIHQNANNDAIVELRKMYQAGADLKRLASDLIEIIKDALIYSNNANKDLLNKIEANEAQDLLKVANVEELLTDANNLQEVLSKDKQHQNFLSYLELCFLKMANKKAMVNVSHETSMTKQEEIKQEIKQVIPEPATTKEGKALENKEKEKVDLRFLLSILLDANKDLKIADQIIYNKLDLYQFEVDKRPYYQMLIGSEMFACNKDAIIICAKSKQAELINNLENNKKLFAFINEEFGINKMVYAIDENEKKELIELYKKEPKENRNKAVYVEKYVLDSKQNISNENRIAELFGDKVKVED